MKIYLVISKLYKKIKNQQFFDWFFSRIVLQSINCFGGIKRKIFQVKIILQRWRQIQCPAANFLNFLPHSSASILLQCLLVSKKHCIHKIMCLENCFISVSVRMTESRLKRLLCIIVIIIILISRSYAFYLKKSFAL